MQRSDFRQSLRLVGLVVLGSAIFALGFDLFLAPNSINVGGMTGLAMVIIKLLGRGSIGLFSALLNVPLFVLGYRKLGKKFFLGSLLGMVLSTTFLELFETIQPPQAEPMLGAIYGGALCGVGLGLVLLPGASTGGSDILARLLKQKVRHLKMGRVMMLLDITIVALTGLVYHDLNKILYSFVTIYVCSVALDAVLYGLDYSAVALIISDAYDEIARTIDRQLDHGVTLLEGEGYYSGAHKRVLLSAVRKRQIGQLKELVSRIDPNAFMILQDAHQVLGKGFNRYGDSL